MSTRVRRSSAAKNTSSWVRPGVCEVLARPLRLVSALMRLDLPTLERPTNAISLPLIEGSETVDPAAETKRHSDANSRRPAPISPAVKLGASLGASGFAEVKPNRSRPRHFFFEQVLDLIQQAQNPAPGTSQIVEQFDLGAVAAHNDRLLDDRQGVVPRPVDHQPG